VSCALGIVARNIATVEAEGCEDQHGYPADVGLNQMAGSSDHYRSMLVLVALVLFQCSSRGILGLLMSLDAHSLPYSQLLSVHVGM